MSFYDYAASSYGAPSAQPAYPPRNSSTSYYEPPVPGQERPIPSSRLDPQQLEEIDSRSVFVGNVEFRSTAEQLKHHFSNCGAINRVTIATNKETGHPRGYGFIEFATKEGATNAVTLTDSVFFERPLKVVSKRTYAPDPSTPRRPRGPRRAPYGYTQPYPGHTAYMPVSVPHGGYVPAAYPPAYPAYAVPPASTYSPSGPIYTSRASRPPRQYEPY